MKFAAIGPIAVHLPEKVEDNDCLGAAVSQVGHAPDLSPRRAFAQRHIAAPDECASDLGVAAAEKLFAEHDIDRSSIDFLLFCTQTPDYALPTTACLMQDRLGLPTSIGALDFNLGCSGFVYGLSLADGLIRGGTARRVLLITAETYSKYIDPTDRSLRTIFGDGAAATLVEAVRRAVARLVRLRHRRPRRRHADGDRRRRPAARPTPSSRASASAGPAASTWTARNWSSSRSKSCRRWSTRCLADAKWTRDDVDMYLMHQATTFMLDHLRERLSLDREHHARGAGRLRQHGLVDDSDPDPRPARVGPAAAGQADAADRFRRRPLLGRLRLDRNLAGQAGPPRRAGQTGRRDC